MSASPETARYVALEMYERLTRHGLEDEAGQVLSGGKENVEENGERENRSL